MVAAEEILERVDNISSLPDVFTKLDEAMNAPNSSFQHIADLISEDAALSLRLLKIANSSLYTFPAPIETIQRAMSVIGTKELRELILATTVINMFDGMEPGFVTMRSFWQHSIGCGVAARVLGTVLRETNVEKLYVAGILHDIGRLILLSQCPKEMKDALLKAQKGGKPLLEYEREVLGFDHAKLGGMLVKKWDLGMALADAVEFHHEPELAEHYPHEARIIHVADVIANAMQLGCSGNVYVPPFCQESWETFGLATSEVSGMVIHIEQQYADAVKLFSSDE